MMKKLAKLKYYFSRQRTSFLVCLLLIFCCSGVFGADQSWVTDESDWQLSGNETVDVDMDGLYFTVLKIRNNDGDNNKTNTCVIDLKGHTLNIGTLTIGQYETVLGVPTAKKSGSVKFTDSVGGGKVVIGTIDASAKYYQKWIEIDNTTLVVNTNLNTNTGSTDYSTLYISGNGTFEINEAAADSSKLVVQDVTVTGTQAATVAVTHSENTWTGNVSNDWAFAANWTSGVPVNTTAVKIPASPAGSNGFPVIDSSNTAAVCKSLNIESGADLTIDGVLTVSSDYTVSGINAASSGTFKTTGKFQTMGTGINVPDLALEAATFENTASLTCKSIIVSGVSTLSSNVTTTDNQTYTGLATIDGNNINLKSTAGGITFEDEIQGTANSNLTLTLEDTTDTKAIVFKNTVSSLKNLTLNGAYNGEATSNIICTGAFTANKGGQFRGDIEAASVSITGPFSLCGACSKVQTTGAQVYNGEASLLRTTAVNLIAGTGGITFKEKIINQNDGAAAKSITFGTALNSVNVTFEKDAGGTNSLDTIYVYGNLTAQGDIKADSITVTGTATIYGNVTTSSANTFSTLEIKGTGTSSFTSANTIETLRCTAAGKTIEFKAGTTQTVTSALTLTGASGNLITLKSDSATKTAAADRFTFDIDGVTSPSVSYVNVENSNASKLISPAYSVTLGNNVNWNIPTAFVWTGDGGDSDWKNLSNWQAGGVTASTYPGESSTTDTVTISTTSDKWPVYTYALDIELKQITVGAAGSTDAEFTWNSANKLVLNNGTNPVLNYGKIIFNNTGRTVDSSDTPIMDTSRGTVEYSGSADVVTNFGSSSNPDYYNLTVKTNMPLESGHQIKIMGNFTLDGSNITTGGQSLYVTGTSSIGGNVETGHNQTYVGKVTFTSATSQLIATALEADGVTPYRVIFNDDIEGLATGTDLTFENVTFSKNFSNINKLTVNQTTVNNGTIQTSGVQTYTGNVSGTGEIKVPEITNTAVVFAGGFGCRTLTGATTTNPVIAFRGGDVTFTNFTHKSDKVQFEPNVDINLITNGVEFNNLSFENKAGKVVLKSNLAANQIAVRGNLEVDTNGTYTISARSNWDHSAATGSFVPEKSTVKVTGTVKGNDTFYNLEVGGDLEGNHTITNLTINGSNSSTSNITGDNTITDFTCRIPNKTLIFTAGKTQTVSGSLTINSSANNEIFLQSSTSGTAWKIDVGATTVSNVIVSDSNATNGTITANASISKGGNTNWIIPGTYYWTGATDTAWNDPSNWEVGFNSSKQTASIWPGQSGSDDIVYVSQENLATGKDYPDLNGAVDIVLKNLYLGDGSYTGKVVLSSSASILVATTFANYGTVTYKSSGRIKNNTTSAVLSDLSHSGTVEFNGTDLIIDDINTNAAYNDYYNLILSGSEKLAGSIRVGGKTSLAGNTAITTDNSSYEITFAAIESPAAAYSLTIGDGSYGINPTFAGNIGTSTEPIKALTVDGTASFQGAITIESNDVITFTNPISPANKLTINNAKTINFAGDNTFANLEVNGKTQVNFDSASFQKFTYLTLKGTDASNRLTFGGTNDWNIYLPAKTYGIFEFVTIQKSTSKIADNSALNELGYNPSSATLLEASVGSAVAWFEHKYYWFGTAADKWSDSAKWFYDDAKTIESPVPVYTDGTSKIILKGNLDIEKDASISTLSLSLSFLKIDANQRFALKDKNLTLTLPGAQGNALENDGTFALHGASGQSVSFTGAGGKSLHGDGSTIEYYGTGDCEDVFAVTSLGPAYCTYKNIKVSKTAGTMSFNKAFSADAFISENTNAVLKFKGDFSISSDTEFNQKIDVQKDGLSITVTGTNTLTFNKDVETSDSANFKTLILNASVTAKKKLQLSEIRVSGGKSLSIDSTTANDFSCDKLTFLGSGSSTFEVTTPAAADIKSLQINSGCTLNTASTFTVKGDWTNNGAFNATAGTITFDAKRSALSPSSEITTSITGTNTFNDVIIQNEDLTMVTGTNSYQNLTIKHGAGNPVQKVQFGANQTQTVNKTLKLTGNDANKILLTTTSASPSTTNQSTWWKLAGIPQYSTAAWSGDQKVVATYAQIEYCAAVNNLTHDWGTGLASMALALSEGTDESTTNLFIRTFYWYGGTSTAWNVPANWSAQEDSEVKLEKMTPPYAANTARIVIVKSENDAGYNTLTLPKAPAAAVDYKIKSFTVNENAIVDLGDSSLSLKANENLINNGRIKMSGTQTLNVLGTGARINGAASTIEYYGDCFTMPWGQIYQNLEFTSGANTSADYTSDLTVNGTTRFINGNNSITLTGANNFKGDVTFGQASPAVSAGNITLSGANNFNSKPISIISGGNLSINANASGVSVNDGALCASLTIQSKATLLGSVTTTGNQTYEGSVTLDDDVNLLAYKASPVTVGQIDFKGTVSGAKNLAIGDRGNSKKSNVIFRDTVGTNAAPIASLDVYGTSAVYKNITTTAAQKYNDALTWYGAVTLKTGDGSYVQFNGGAVPYTGVTDKLTVDSITYLTGDGNFGGGSGIDLNKNVFVGNIIAAKSIAIKDNVTAKADFYISSETTGTLSIDSPLSVTGNLALFNGKVDAKANVTAGKDIVLLSGSVIKDGDGTAGTSGQDIFVYNLADRACAPSLVISSLSPPSEFTFNTATYSSSLSPSSGITIQAGQNFFDNGVSLSGTGSWNLKLKDNTDSKDAFAEIYNATVKNCQVSAISGTAYLAAEESTDGGSNTNVFFTRPKIKTAYTEYDDVIKVEFWDGTNALTIENTNDEIWTEFTTRAWYGNDGKVVKFAGTYTDVECTVKTTGRTDLTEFYLKANVPDADSGDGKWNTDATGSSLGAAESTDRSGTHRTAVPYINLPKALSASYFGLRDVHKNRVASYYTAPQADLSLSPVASNFAPGKTYTATEDGCAPVLTAVLTGREKHIDPHSATPTQKQYDAHNFIEFVYSEPVVVGTVADYNTGSTAALGDIQTMGTGITVKGLATLQNGSVNAASKASKPVHSLYRKFDTGSGEILQTHRVRVAIAGYVDGNITVNGKTYFNWTSYIEGATLPSGDVTRIANANIKDKTSRTTKNTVPAAGTTQHPLPDLTVINEKDTNLYVDWDVTPPSFVPLRLNGTEWTSALENGDQYEAVGAAYSGHTTLDSIEVHMFDDQPSYTAYTRTTAGDGSVIETGEKNQWFSKIGWDDVDTNNRNNSGNNIIPAANQRGGIRYSSIYNIASSFRYKEYDDVTFSNFDTKNLEGGAESSVFTPAAGFANSTLNEDGCYYKIYFPTSTNLDPKLKFMLEFDADSVYLTDLAGNRIRNRASGNYFIPTVDRTPPAINMTATPCGKDELYIVFAKSIKTDPYKVYKDANTSTEISNPLEYIPKALEIQGTPRVQIDTTRPAKLVHRTFNSTGFIVYLDKEVNWQDIKAGYKVKIIATQNPDHRYDPLSGVTADVTYIQDDMGNYASAGSIHTLTDFAVNVVDVEYAYNEDINDTSGNNIQMGLYEDGSWAVHDWSELQGNYGVLNPNYDVFMRTKFFDGTQDNSQGAVNIGQLTMRFDENPDPNTVSSEYNSFSGRQWRIWLPYSYTNIAPAGNSSADSLSIGPTAPDEDPYHFDFKIPFKTGSLPEYGDGDTVSFLFEITDSGQTVQVDHFGNGVKEPLYALRLSDPNDSSSLDLWSFKLRDTIRQRGGVTILNNVINPLNGEKTVVRTDFTGETNVNIMVMTLDGNIVTYLNRGTIPGGEQYLTWDGRNTKGEVVARGMYFVRIVGNGIDETRKVMVVK